MIFQIGAAVFHFEKYFNNQIWEGKLGKCEEKHCSTCVKKPITIPN